MDTAVLRAQRGAGEKCLSLPLAHNDTMDAATSLWTLFVSSFLAATLLPGGSEAVLFAVLKSRPDELWNALAVATAGNTLGGLTSYGIGRLVPSTKPMKGLATLQRY